MKNHQKNLQIEQWQRMVGKNKQPSESIIRLIRDSEDVIVHSELVSPMPLETIQKNFGGWNCLEEIVRWVEEFHGIK